MLAERASYAGIELNETELAATEWLDGFYQLEHLLCAWKWIAKLCPHTSSELRFAALVHDAERHFPGGPTSMPQSGFDDPDYLFAHSIRSANIVQGWLEQRGHGQSAEWVKRVRRFILRHEIGGNWEEDILQAADSLAFLEALDWLAVEWILNGHYSVQGVKEKLTWTVERIRPLAGISAALPLYARVVRAIETAQENKIDLKSRRLLASHKSKLLDPQWQHHWTSKSRDHDTQEMA